MDSEINYLYATSAEGTDPNALAEPMRGAVREMMAEAFTGNRINGRRFEGASTLAKYQWLLEAAGKRRLPGHKNPYTNAELLVGIRNRLLHYQQGPVVVSSDDPNVPVPVAKFARQLSGRGIKENPFAPPGEPFFPRRMLSYALSDASIAWAVNWVDAFYARLAVTPDPLDGVRHEIRTT